MRRSLAGVSIIAGAAACLAILCAGPAPARASDQTGPAETLKGIVEKVEGDRFLLDSVWVEPTPGAHFGGRAHRYRDIRVGKWVEAQGSLDGRGIFVADWIVSRHRFPGHTYQHRLIEDSGDEWGSLSGSGAVYRQPEAERYVDWLGMQLVPSWARDRFDFRFVVLADPNPNAFAFPNGTVFVHTGLVAAVENDDQLAAILGHEVAHVTQYHGARAYKAYQIRSFFAEMAQTALQAILEEKEEKGKADPFLVVVAEIGIEMAAGIAVSGYGRQYEDQADRVGLRYAVAAGFDPLPAPAVWRLLGAGGGKGGDVETGGDRGQGGGEGREAGDEGAPRVRYYFYANRDSNRARRANQEREIKLHYADPARVAAPRPEPPLAHTYLAAIAIDTSRGSEGDAEAEAECRRAIEADPAYPEARRVLGTLLARRGRPDEARSQLETYLSLAPSDAPHRPEVESALKALPPGT